MKIQHFLEYIRNNMYLSTSEINTEFIKNLAARSNNTFDDTKNLFDYINELHDEFWSRDEVLTHTINARVGLDPKDIYDELTALVFSNLNENKEISAFTP